MSESKVTVEVNDLNFSYCGIDGQPIEGPPVLQNVSFRLEAGSRTLLLGANGAGKTTLLKILGGKHMVGKDQIRVLGRPAFHDTTLTSSGELVYLGGQWRRDIAFAGYDVPLQGDFPASKMLNSVPNVSEERKQRIIKTMDVNPEWRMHQVSDGQRRRVQIAVGLLKPFQVLLLDEITVDLDVLGRRDLLKFLKSECEERNITIVYCTHIFDGLDDWATHLAYVARGTVQIFKPIVEIPEIEEEGLSETIQKWLRKEKKILQELKALRQKEGPLPQKKTLNNGYGAGRLNPTIKGASNAVLRC